MNRKGDHQNTKRTGLESFILDLMSHLQEGRPPKQKEGGIKKFYIRLDVTSAGRKTTKNTNRMELESFKLDLMSHQQEGRPPKQPDIEDGFILDSSSHHIIYPCIWAILARAGKI